VDYTVSASRRRGPPLSAAATIVAGPSSALVWGAAGVALLMLVLWGISIRIRDVSIIDPAWGPAFVIVATAGVAAGDGCLGRRWLMFALTALWGVRLGIYLTVRKLRDPAEDKRYAAMREREGDWFIPWSLWWIFGFQGLLVLVVSLPISVVAGRPGTLTAAIIPGILVWAVGLGFEAVGDEQLRRFKADPANRGRVMDRGLWRYTRHPNYFGDFCVWWGIWLVSLPAGGTWWTFIGPLVMTILLMRVSGKALLERDIAERRPEYADYVERTSGFFPRPPKRG
jgi:steroid 5-alpha reductase family enzyme